jgi:hypothetical protein
MSTAKYGILRITINGDSTIGYTDPVATTGPNSIPSVEGGFVQKINDSHYLVGTKENGVYEVTTKKYYQVDTATQVPMTGPNSIPSVEGGTITKVDLTHYLIGTNSDGLYEVSLDSSSLKINFARRNGTISNSKVT